MPALASLIRKSVFNREKETDFSAPSSATLADAMPDDPKPEPQPVRFPVVVNVNGVKVEVVLLLKPGTAVTVEGTKTTTEQPPSEPGRS